MKLEMTFGRAAVCVTTLAILFGGCGDDEPSGDPTAGTSGTGTSSAGSGGGEPPSNAGEGGGPVAGNAGTSPIEGGQKAGGAAGEAGASAGAPSPTGGAAGAAGAGGSGSSACLVDSQCLGQSCVGGAPATLCLPPHVACASHADCALDEYCDGYCRPAELLSAPCSPGNRCGTTEVGPNNRIVQMWCVDGACREPLLVGQDCPDWNSPPDLCELGTSCSRSFVDQDTITCQPWGEAFDFCDFGRRCKPELHCLIADDFDENICVPRLRLGDLCGPNDAPCEEGVYCSYDEGSCLLSPGEGEPCVVSLHHTSPPPGAPLCDTAKGTDCSPCALGLVCQAGVCRRPAAEGAACDSIRCESGLACVPALLGGVCDD